MVVKGTDSEVRLPVEQEQPPLSWIERYQKSVYDSIQVEDAFALYSLKGMLSPIHRETIQQYGLKLEDLTLEAVVGFGAVMQEWAAALAAASLPKPSSLRLPPLPADTFIERLHPALFAETATFVEHERHRGIFDAQLAKEALVKDPSGKLYLHARLREEVAKATKGHDWQMTQKHRQITGMQKAVIGLSLSFR